MQNPDYMFNPETVVTLVGEGNFNVKFNFSSAVIWLSAYPQTLYDYHYSFVYGW